MDKNIAIRLIEDTFNAKFDEDKFSLFIKNFLNDIEPKNNSYNGQFIWDDYKEHINAYKRIGKYIDPEGDSLDVLIVEVKSVSKLERARTTLRNFVIKHLSKFEKDFALVAFYSKQDDGEDWRFSFIKLEHQSYLDSEKGKVKTRKEFTPAKRYSFLVGKYEDSYTAKKQLLPLLQNVNNNPTIEELEGAFSIEKVTDEFFQQYYDLYVKLFKHFSNDNVIQAELRKSNIDTARFTKKLLGQIVFLYFLQKKGWLGVPKNGNWGQGKRRFVQELFEKSRVQNLNFFKDFLQYLFYEALAKERNNDNSYYKRFDCRIPFLNGGLFEAEYNWQDANIFIPEYLFKNEEKNKSGDIGTGVLNVFDRYNFTIKEDEPLDKEVAVDPEMLGKVFENMLDVTERKSSGAFYTPREIVHYMCQESLIHYLDNSLNDYSETYLELGNNQLNMFGNQGKKGQQSLNASIQKITVPKKDIEIFIREGHFALENDQRVAEKGRETKDYKYAIPGSIRQHADLIDKKLTEIKICDPAIGSGAFPVGLLHELVKAQMVIKPHLSSMYLVEKLEILQSNEISQDLSESRYIYRLKRHIIQESIYGVDTDASAIDIARLRLWLSLVVDEDDLEPIETLPNLDYKIVCGNSLIGMPENAMHDLNIEKELESLKTQFYNQTNETERKDLRIKINTKIRELLDSAEIYAGYKIDFDFKLFFSEVWHNHDKGGFDLVIGNPPYIRISKTPRKEILKKIGYDTFVSSGDLYSLFYEKGNRILKEKGDLCFITSNKWINAGYGSKTRKFFAERVNPLVLIDFAKIRIFPNATVFVNILLFKKEKNRKKLKAVSIQGTKIPSEPIDLYFGKKKIELNNINEEVWKISSSAGCTINARIEQMGTSLKFWPDIEFFRGITTGLNSAFHITENQKIDIIKEDMKSEELIKPLLRGKDIKRWKYDFQKCYIIFTKQGVDISLYPGIESYLKKYYDELTPKISQKDKTGRKPGKYKWYEIQDNTAYYRYFEKPKIVWIEISDKANFAFDSNGHYLTNSAYFISGVNLKYLIAVLNSSVADYYFFQITAKIAGGRKRYTKQYVEQIPIPQIGREKQKPYEILVDYLNSYKVFDDNLVFNFFEQLLDAIVFECYFEDKLKSANKQIISQLGNLKTISDEMSDEEKLAIIESEFERLYDPNHPVRNNLETLDSIEEIRIIKEAIK